MNQSTKTRIRAAVVVVLLLAATGTLFGEWMGARKANTALTQQLQSQTDSTAVYKHLLVVAYTQAVACGDTIKTLRSHLGTTQRAARKTHASLDTALVTLTATQKQLDSVLVMGPMVVRDTVMVLGPERFVRDTVILYDTVTHFVTKSRSVLEPEWGKGLWATAGFAAGFGTGWILGENSATSRVYVGYEQSSFRQSRSMLSIFTLRF
jgi:hypothetical protein